MFTSAGLLEGLDQEQQQKQRQRTTFDEDMQTRVYMEAHDAQRQGRRGLGKSTTLKIAGGVQGLVLLSLEELFSRAVVVVLVELCLSKRLLLHQ